MKRGSVRGYYQMPISFTPKLLLIPRRLYVQMGILDRHYLIEPASPQQRPSRYSEPIQSPARGLCSRNGELGYRSQRRASGRNQVGATHQTSIAVRIIDILPNRFCIPLGPARRSSALGRRAEVGLKKPRCPAVTKKQSSQYAPIVMIPL